MTDRYYVSLSATCDKGSLSTVLDRMSAAIPSLSTLGLLDGLTLSYTREDDDSGDMNSTIVEQSDADLPPSGPVVSSGPGTPPPDAVTPAPIIPDAEPAQDTPTAPADAPTIAPQPSPAVPDPDPLSPAPADADGAHAAPEEQP